MVKGGGSLLDKDPPSGQLGLELGDPLDLELAHLGRMVQSVRVKIQRRVRAGREGGSLQQPSLLVWNLNDVLNVKHKLDLGSIGTSPKYGTRTPPQHS